MWSSAPSRLRRSAGAASAALPALLLAGCAGAAPLPAPCPPESLPPPGQKEVSVYFGCGCFWHMQYGFVITEMSKLCRQGPNLTARVAYAGGTRVGHGGLVCYHNMDGVADYGEMGHAEVVSLTVPEASFDLFAARFWGLCSDGNRQDPQDMGGEYRSVVGLPGGMDSRFLPQLRKAAGSTRLVRGAGNEGDTLGAGEVLVYDTASFPAHIAEKYHQFHDDMMESYGGAYNSLSKWAKNTECPGDQDIIVQ